MYPKRLNIDTVIQKRKEYDKKKSYNNFKNKINMKGEKYLTNPRALNIYGIKLELHNKY